MARSSRTHTLVGFSEALDWRPLKFAQPVPAAAICDSCGYVPRSTCSLPCGHTLCEPCHRRCAAGANGAEFECPFDGDVCSAEDVARRDCSRNLMRRKVHCWNEANGCTVVLPASEVTEHFHRDCQHHAARCPTCLATVLWNDVCAHHKSRCADFILRAAADVHPGTDGNQNGQLVAFEKNVEKRAVELNAKLAQLSLESASQSDRLIALCHGINDLNETLAGQFRAASDRNEHSLERNADIMKAVFMEKSEALMSAIVAMSPPIQNDPETQEWVLTGYAALKEKALTEGVSFAMSGKAYLRRYLMSWGVHLKNSAHSVCICLRHCIHKGRYDEFLDWPFAHEMKLVAVHPTTREEHEIRALPCAFNNAEVYSKPTAFSNKAVFFGVRSFDPTVLEWGGFIKNDQLFLRFEVLL
ncbi:uncharacterized protein LOC144162786 [Haemaphysalis longicornis]